MNESPRRFVFVPDNEELEKILGDEPGVRTIYTSLILDEYDQNFGGTSFTNRSFSKKALKRAMKILVERELVSIGKDGKVIIKDFEKNAREVYL